MKRLASLVLAAAVTAVVIATVSDSSGHAQSTARFDVIFDDARGLVAGQLVKIAGARAGSIDNVVLTSAFKARIEASVDRRFVPFHANATCTIRPEGLIAENYLECDPGTAGSPVLEPSDGHPPTVPVAHTTEPVGLLDLFNTFNLPTSQRMAVIVDELGIATAGRGEDFNQILERANPTLAAARDAISILTRQRTQLQTLIDSSNRVAAAGASGKAELQRFLDRAAAVSSLTATHSGALSQSIARLPALLAATRPSLSQLDAIATQGTPLLQQLRVTAPSLNRVANDLGPFAAVAKPSLSKLSGALGKAIPAIRQSTPLIRTVSGYSSRSKANTALAANLFTNLERHGFSESFLSVIYYTATSLARFDGTSHILPLYVIAPQNGACGQYATKPVAGCSAHFGQQPGYQPARAKRARARGGPAGRPASSTASPSSQAGGGPSSPSQSAPAAGATGALPVPAPAPPASPSGVLQAIANYLLK
ncbi:MAG TPA: MlaD family protein [Solirubrobacteraceae bacterium]|jgi:virulence factor Mce-like protein